jgi:hypothetical protein
VSATSSNWTSADPVDAIDAKIEAISNATGLMANRIVFSLAAWRIFKNADPVKARITSGNTKTRTATVLLNDVGSLFLNPSVEVMVGTSVFDAKLNATESKANALTDTNPEVWIFNASQNSNTFDPGAFKTFRVRANPIDGVRISQKDYGEKVMVDWTESAYVNNAAAAARLTVTTS